jgi:hypothetical protein
MRLENATAGEPDPGSFHRSIGSCLGVKTNPRV